MLAQSPWLHKTDRTACGSTYLQGLLLERCVYLEFSSTWP